MGGRMRGTAPRMLAALAAVTLAGACGGGGAAPGDESDAGGGNGGGGSVSVAAVWTGAEQESFQAVLDAFTEETGIQTSFKSTGDDIATYLGSQVAGGDPPDVAFLPQPGLLQSLADQGNLKPVGDEAEQNVSEHFAPYWSTLASVDDTLYGVYFKASNKSTWWYNAQAFQNAGVQPPETWDDMLADTQTMTAYGLPYVAIGGADGWPLTDWFENIYLRQAGPEMYDKLTAHEIPWTHPSVTDALETFRALLTQQGAVNGGADGALQTDFTESVNQVLAAEPQAASVYEGDFVPGVATSQDIQAGTDYSFFPFPSIDGSGPAVVGGGDVAVTLTGSEEAQQLLAFLATPEAARIWVERGGFTSPNADVPLSAYPDDLSRRNAESVVEAADAGNFRFDMSDQTPPEFGGVAGRGLWGGMQDLLRNPDNVQAVQEQLEREAASAYGGGD